MGIGFAIPVNMVKSVVAAAEHGGRTVKRALAHAQPAMQERLQATLRIRSASSDARSAPSVLDVAAESPAAKAGLKRGDVILQIDGQDVDDAQGVAVSSWA